MRTVDDSWWLIVGIAVVSYLLVKLFKDDGYVAMNTSILAIILGAIIFIAVGYDAYDFRPSHRIHVAGVDRRFEFPDVDFCLDELEFGHG